MLPSRTSSGTEPARVGMSAGLKSPGTCTYTCTYFEDNACNEQLESKYEAASKDHISNDEEEYENTEIFEKGIKNTDALIQEKETVDHEYAMDEISEPEHDTLKPVYIYLMKQKGVKMMK